MGITVADDELVRLALLGPPNSWHNYKDFVYGWENLPYWERLWSDLVSEEIRRTTMDGSSSKHDDEVDFSLATKEKMKKGKKFHSRSEASEYGKEHNMSKVKCFHCHKFGHIATNCPHKKKNKMVVGATTGESLASQFELEFSLIACMVSSALGSGWYFDSGLSFHMAGDVNLFSDLVEKDL